LINSPTLRLGTATQGEGQRPHAAQRLAHHLEQLTSGPPRPLGEFGGLPLDAQLTADPTGGQLRVELTFHGLPARPATLPRGELAASALSLIRQLEHRLDSLRDLAVDLDQRRHAHVREADSARDQLAKPFRYAEHLARARERQAKITQEMQARQPPEPDSTHPQALVDGGEQDPVLRAPG
jgi:hypothetical protein